ncbi:MAG: MBL fold metallo-hydrolase [Salinisphaera sp.]|jgi:glyoxylase-like metal-dependent hydrolase (beta-lactamase superfamily II)|nr:MBL fold metallo-hydrolase [Salinisphaera sp.]
MNHKPQAGKLVSIAPGIRRLTASNPGPMTGPGTNSYIVGYGPFAIIDPGVDDPAHLERLLTACDGELIGLLLTHRHSDHVGGVPELARRSGAWIGAFEKTTLGSYDAPLRVDRPLIDGERLELGGVRLDVLHTPGHAADHLCFLASESGLLFAGDSVMADVTVVILPPDGSMTDYMTTLNRLAAIPMRHIAPGHGRLLDDPAATIAGIMAHRRDREAQVLNALEAIPMKPDTIAARLYPELDSQLLPMAAAQVEAHLIRLGEVGAARHDAAGWQRTR